MFDALFPGAGAWIDGMSVVLQRYYWLIAAAIVAFGVYRSHWRSKFPREMRKTFEATNLFIKPKKDKLFPQLLSLSAKEDEVYYTFRYRLRPGMTVPQFEEKKKFFEATFHSDVKVYGKAGVVTIKVKKQGHTVPPTAPDQSTWPLG